MRTQTTSHESVEMYLKTIAELSDGVTPVGIPQLAERLDVTAVSANEMVKRLSKQGFLEHVRYKGVILTEKGRTTAHHVMRRQRLWECFLVDHLQLNWAGAYESACRLEHATSAVVAEALANFLGQPAYCPHGNPIPKADATLPPFDTRPLTALSVGEQGRIQAVRPTTTAVYAYLQERHLLPGQTIKLHEIAPLDGPLTLGIADQKVVLGQNLAALIMIATSEGNPT